MTEATQRYFLGWSEIEDHEAAEVHEIWSGDDLGDLQGWIIYKRRHLGPGRFLHAFEYGKHLRTLPTHEG